MAAPTISALTPATGLSSGGTAVVLTGTNLSTVRAVKFGSVAAASFVVVSATTIGCTAPAQAAGAVNITVTNPDGTSSDTATYTYTGSALFSVAEARAYDKGQLSNTSIYTTAAIIAKEAAIRDEFETIIGVSLISTTFTEYYDGDGSNVLYLKHHQPWMDPTPSPVTLTSVTVIATDDTETAFTATELSNVVKYPDKLVRRSGTFTSGNRNIKVVYTCGYSTVPVDIKQAALQVLTMAPPYGLVPSSVSSYAFEGADGAINWRRLPDPEKGQWYGHEMVDATLRRHRNIEQLPGLA